MFLKSTHEETVSVVEYVYNRAPNHVTNREVRRTVIVEANELAASPPETCMATWNP